MIGDKVCELVKRIWRNPSEIMNINQIDICLIPKVDATSGFIVSKNIIV